MRRGPQAFDDFYTVMLKSENKHVADLLRQHLNGNELTGDEARSQIATKPRIPTGMTNYDRFCILNKKPTIYIVLIRAS